MVQPKNSFERFSARKKPQQKRSQIVFDKILESAAELFQEEGYAYVSTNRIADYANISIGSIYQYFPNCEAIALAIYERSSSEAATKIRRAALGMVAQGIGETTQAMVSLLFELFERDQYVLLKLVHEVPDLRGASRVFSFETLIRHAVQLYFEQHLLEASREEIMRKAYFVEKCVVGATSRFLEEQPDFISKEQAIEQVTAIVTRYLEI